MQNVSQLENTKQMGRCFQLALRRRNVKAQSDSRQMLLPFMETESFSNNTKKETQTLEKKRKSFMPSPCLPQSESKEDSSLKKYTVLGVYVMEIPTYVTVEAKDEEEAREKASNVPETLWNFGEETDWEDKNHIEVRHCLTNVQMEFPFSA